MLEAAIVANPDDLAARAVYADWLLEQGDPRGELNQVELTLENGSISNQARRKLQAREKVLLAKHARTWLGSLAGPVFARPDIRFSFAGGWLDTLQIGMLRKEFSSILATAPQSRLLRRLVITGNYRHPRRLDRVEAYQNRIIAGPVVVYYPEEKTALDPLLKSKFLRNIREDRGHRRLFFPTGKKGKGR